MIVVTTSRRHLQLWVFLTRRTVFYIANNGRPLCLGMHRYLDQITFRLGLEERQSHFIHVPAEHQVLCQPVLESAYPPYMTKSDIRMRIPHPRVARDIGWD